MTTIATNRETGGMISVFHECVKQETLELLFGTVLVVDDETGYGSVWKHSTLLGFTVPVPFGRKCVNEKHPHNSITVGKTIYDIDYTSILK